VYIYIYMMLADLWFSFLPLNEGFLRCGACTFQLWIEHPLQVLSLSLRPCSLFIYYTFWLRTTYMHACRVQRQGREGSNAPLTFQNFSLLLEFYFFSKVLVAHPKKLINGQIFSKRIEFHGSHHYLPFFHWFFTKNQSL